MRVIDIPLSMELAAIVGNKFNEQFPKYCAKMLKPQEMETLHAIYRVYAVELINKKLRVEQVDPASPPMLATNNGQIATMASKQLARKRSKRTVQRHREKLRKAGLIASEVDHGPSRNYEIALHPNVIHWGYKPSHSDRMKIRSQIRRGAFPLALTTDCRPSNTNSKEFFEPFNILIGTSGDAGDQRRSPADKAGGQIKSIGDFLPDQNPGDAGEQSPDNQNDGNQKRNTNQQGPGLLEAQENEQERSPDVPDCAKEKKEGAGGAAAPNDTKRQVKGQEGKAPKKLSPALLTHLQVRMNIIWLMILDLLYEDRYISDWQMDMGEKHLYSFFKSCTSIEAVNEKEKITKGMVKVVHKWLSKDRDKGPGKYVPLPSKYLDPANEYGFRAAYGWYMKEKERKKEVAGEIAKGVFLVQVRKNLALPPEKAKDHTKLVANCGIKLRGKEQPGLVRRFFIEAAQIFNEFNDQKQKAS